MSVLEIILSVGNLVFGSGFVLTLVTLKQARRKAITEVEKGNIELVTSSVNEMLQSVNSLMTQNRELVQEVVNRNNENTDLKKKLETLSKKLDRMQRAIRDVLVVLEKLDVDEQLLRNLKEEIK
jgi:predicted RNase H-like nuclease (RuvC/YqgF family)